MENKLTDQINRFREHKKTILEFNERRVRESVIDSILKTLGWDVNNEHFRN